MSIDQLRIFIYPIGFALTATLTHAAEALPLAEARKEFIRWDRSIYNGLLRQTE
jgi:hypothetical protein